MRITAYGMTAECDIKDTDVRIRISGYKIPLRVYVIGKSVFYAGIPEPIENYGILSFNAPFKPECLIITEGKFDESYKEIFRFDLSGIICYLKSSIPENFKNEFEKALFNQKSLKSCIDFYGHYIVFEEKGIITYAFPSDFFTHPLTEFLPYSYYYDIDICGKNRGYYFISCICNKPSFVNLSKVIHLIENKSVFSET